MAQGHRLCRTLGQVHWRVADATTGSDRRCQTFELGLKTINQRLEKNASLAYMEMASPSLEHVISKNYLQGERSFEVLPLFFAAGRHLLHDVPEKITRLNQQFKGVDITLLNEITVDRKGDDVELLFRELIDNLRDSTIPVND